MLRTSLSVHARLIRGQAARQKREAIDGAANADALARHVAERSMLLVVDTGAGALKPAEPKAVPVEAPAARVAPRIAENVSENEIDSHDAAFETGMSKQPWNLGSKGSGQTGLREDLRAAMEFSRLAGREVPANGHESPATAA